jgi:hypothetical protein
VIQRFKYSNAVSFCITNLEGKLVGRLVGWLFSLLVKYVFGWLTDLLSC